MEVFVPMSHAFAAEGADCKGLCFASREECRTVSSWKEPKFDPNRTNLICFATIAADMLCQYHLAHMGGLDFLKCCHHVVFRIFWLLSSREEVGNEGLFCF